MGRKTLARFNEGKNVSPFDGSSLDEEEEEIILDQLRGERLHTIYTAIKGWYEKNKFRKKSKDKRVISIFSKVAGRLNACERETELEIDDILFVVALFAKYGKGTYPGHLLGKAATDIYYEQVDGLYNRRTPPLDQVAHDKKLLRHLSEVRGETEEEVIEALEDAGVFSHAFLKKWKLAHGKE